MLDGGKLVAKIIALAAGNTQMMTLLSQKMEESLSMTKPKRKLKEHINGMNSSMTQDKLSYQNKLRKDERYCGNCCWMVGEGMCAKILDHWVNCSDKCYKKELFTSRKAMRHYLAVLIQHNRWRRDNDTPNSRKPVDARELGKAIDFAVDYCKTFMKL